MCVSTDSTTRRAWILLGGRKNSNQPLLADVQGKMLACTIAIGTGEKGDDWAREQSAATTLVPGTQ